MVMCFVLVVQNNHHHHHHHHHQTTTTTKPPPPPPQQQQQPQTPIATATATTTTSIDVLRTWIQDCQVEARMQQMEAVGLEIDEASWAEDPSGYKFTNFHYDM